MKTFKISVLLLCLVSIFGFSSAYALPAGTANAVESVQQTDSKKWTKAERKSFKKAFKAKIKQERKKAKELRKSAKKAGQKVSKPQRDFSNRSLLIGLLIGLGLILLGSIVPFLGSIVSLIGSIIVLIVIILFILRYV